MESFFRFLFVFFTLPTVMAILCYNCLPGPPGELCTTVRNITDCDTAPGAPPGEKFDACGKVSYELAYGDNQLTMNALQCAVKSRCDMVKEDACNATMWQQMGLNLTKCNFSCCSEDKCNCLNPPCGLPHLPWLRRSSPHF